MSGNSETVVYQKPAGTHPLRTAPANPCCGGECGGTTCASNIPIKCYNPYSASQSFFLRMKKQTRAATSSSCAGYSPDCANGGCSNSQRTCRSQTGKQRITTYQKTGSNSSPFRGGGSEKELLRRIKQRAATTVRGRQTSQAALIRASRPVQPLPFSTVGRPTVYGTGIMLARTPLRARAWNEPQMKECCTDTGASVNEVRGFPQSVIGPGNVCKGPCTCGFCPTLGQDE